MLFPWFESLTQAHSIGRRVGGLGWFWQVSRVAYIDHSGPEKRVSCAMTLTSMSQ